MGKAPKKINYYEEFAQSNDTDYSEGDLVTCPNKQPGKSDQQVTGTVIHCIGKDVMVLDASGIIHICKDHEIYHAQK